VISAPLFCPPRRPASRCPAGHRSDCDREGLGDGRKKSSGIRTRPEAEATIFSAKSWFGRIQSSSRGDTAIVPPEPRERLDGAPSIRAARPLTRFEPIGGAGRREVFFAPLQAVGLRLANDRRGHGVIPVVHVHHQTLEAMGGIPKSPAASWDMRRFRGDDPHAEIHGCDQSAVGHLSCQWALAAADIRAHTSTSAQT